MTRRLTDSETRPLMLKAGLLPLVPYPGNNKPWKCRCLSCNEEVSPHYGSVRSGRGGCIHCGKRAAGATQRLSGYETVQRMNERDLEPRNWGTGQLTLIHTALIMQIEEIYTAHCFFYSFFHSKLRFPVSVFIK